MQCRSGFALRERHGKGGHWIGPREAGGRSGLCWSLQSLTPIAPSETSLAPPLSIPASCSLSPGAQERPEGAPQTTAQLSVARQPPTVNYEHDCTAPGGWPPTFLLFPLFFVLNSGVPLCVRHLRGSGVRAFCVRLRVPVIADPLRN